MFSINFHKTLSYIWMSEHPAAVSIESPIDKILPPFITVPLCASYASRIISKVSYVHMYTQPLFLFRVMYAVADSVSNQQRHIIYLLPTSYIVLHESLHINIIHSYIAKAHIQLHHICIERYIRNKALFATEFTPSNTTRLPKTHQHSRQKQVKHFHHFSFP